MHQKMDRTKCFDEVPTHRGQNASRRHFDMRGHRPPFTTAPVADSQRSSDPLLFTLALARIARGDGRVLMFLRCDG
jgi:hypothetical protein